jgi:G:T/U-mismatch repair DNA glycosylase
LFSRLHLAVADIIYRCTRRKHNNSDTNLTRITYNVPVIEKIISQNQIGTIYFSSRFVEARFIKLFKNVSVRLITLPSPSPRYARLNLKGKIRIYSRLLPKVK